MWLTMDKTGMGGKRTKLAWVAKVSNWHGWQTYQTDMGGKHTDMGGTYQTGMGGKSTKLAWMAKAPNKSQATLFRSSLVASEPRWPHPKELQFEANKHVICTDIQTEPSEDCRWRHLYTMYTFWAISMSFVQIYRQSQVKPADGDTCTRCTLSGQLAPSLRVPFKRGLVPGQGFTDMEIWRPKLWGKKFLKRGGEPVIKGAAVFNPPHGEFPNWNSAWLP